MKRDEIIEDILTPIYQYVKDTEDPTVTYELIPPSPHKVAVLYILFALGALVDLTLPAYNAEAESYHQLARGALSLRSHFDSPEIATVQAVVLIASYHTLAGRRYTMDSAWTILSLGVKLAQGVSPHACLHTVVTLRMVHETRLVYVCQTSLYLCRMASLILYADRDSARWNHDPKTVQRRRNLFWEIATADNFYVSAGLVFLRASIHELRAECFARAATMYSVKLRRLPIPG